MVKIQKWWFAALAVAGLMIIVAGALALKGANGAPAPAAARAGSAPAPSSSTRQAAAAMGDARQAETDGRLLDAKKSYQQALQQDASDASSAGRAQERLADVNLKLIFSPTPTPDSEMYEVKPGDTLSKIAKQYHTTVELIRIANGLSSDMIRVGQRIKVTKASFSVVVDKSQNTLTLKNGEEVVKVYRCSTGKEGITPTGNFKIINRIVDPPWFSHDGVIPPGDPRNVLGTRWMGFNIPQYGIHGTTDPDSIGKPVTQGCVRLKNSDVEELFALLPVDTSVTIVE